MLNIFVNTWGNYNANGADGGEWITLPMEAEELEEVLNNIAAAMGDKDPEWAIHDYGHRYSEEKEDCRSEYKIYILPLPCQLELSYYFDFALQI